MDKRPDSVDDTQDQPLVPDNAFSSTPTPETPAPITSTAPAPQNETSPYQGETETMPFTEGDKIRGWTTGLGEERGGEPLGNTTTGGETT
jgi:hypothetical protein